MKRIKKIAITKKILVAVLSISMLFGNIELSNLFNHKLIAATVNDKSLENFMDEVSSLYAEEEITNMVPDITFTKESEDIVVINDTKMVPLEIATNTTDVNYTDIENDIVEQNDQELIAVEDITKNTDYEIIQENEESITISKIYQSKTLIVKSPIQIDTYDASKVISGYGDLYILKYDTEEDTKNAYEKLLTNKNIDSVEVDSIVSTETIVLNGDEEKTINNDEKSLLPVIEETEPEIAEEMPNEETIEESPSMEVPTETPEMRTSEETPMPVVDTSEKPLIIEAPEEIPTTDIPEKTPVMETLEEIHTVEIPDGVIVAVIDSGIDKHNELFDGKIVDLGLNFSTSGEGIQDDNGHGTAVSSIIAKNSDAYIMPIKIANSEGKGTSLSLYLAIMAAIENKADIINISLTTSNSELLTSSIKEADNAGIKLVAAAGNQSANVENYAPANIENVITIAATDKNYNTASYSNYGELIDYAALGEMEIEALNGITTMEGTSLSAAYVTAVIANILSLDENANVTEKLSEYIYDLGEEGKDIYYGNGVVSLEEIKINNEPVDIEGFDFKVRQSLLDNTRDNYKLEIFTNADVEYTFDGGTWQKSNYIEINRNEEFYDGSEYMTSVRQLGIKDKDENTVYKYFQVLDCNNPKNPVSQEIDLAAAHYTTVSDAAGDNALYAPDESSANQDTYYFSYNIGDIATTTANNNNTAVITEYRARGTGATASYPNTVKIKSTSSGTEKTYTLKVVGIGNGTCSLNTDTSDVAITSITIPSNIKSINEKAFEHLTEITKVTFSSGSKCTTIRNSAFQGCTSLTNVINNTTNYTLPSTIQNIGDYAFADTGLTSIKITSPSTMELGKEQTIGNYAFQNCSALTSVTIGNGVISLGNHAFENCPDLSKVTFADGSLLGSIGDYCFRWCFSLSDVLYGTKKNTLPYNLREICKSAFWQCYSLTELTYDKNIYYENSNSLNGGERGDILNPLIIGDSAFGYCKNLKSFTDGTEGDCAHLSERITSVGNYAFDDTAIDNIRILNADAGGLVSPSQNVRCYKGSVAESKANASRAHVVTIINNESIATNTESTMKDLFSGIGRYKFNYTGSSSYYYENNSKVSSDGFSNLNMHNLEYSHSSWAVANSSGAKLDIDSDSSVKAAYLVLEYNADTTGYKNSKDYYVTLSYNKSKETTNFTPDASIEFKPAQILYAAHNNATAYVDVTDFIKLHKAGYYYCANIPFKKATGDLSANWKIIVIEKNRSYDMKAVILSAGFNYVVGGDWTSSKTISKKFPNGITSKTSAQGYMDLIYGITNSDTTIDLNRVQYKLGTSFSTIGNVTNGSYYVRTARIPCRLLFTKNGIPLEQIRNQPTTYYVDTSSLTASSTATKYTTESNDYPVTGSDTEIITIPINGEASSISARVQAHSRALVLNTLGAAVDVEGVAYESTQTTTVNSATSVTVTGRSTNTTGVDNVGIYNGDYVVTLDSGLSAISASAIEYTGSESIIRLGTIDETGHKVTFNLSTLTKGSYIDYTIKCETSNSGKTLFRNYADYSGYYYYEQPYEDYLETVTTASSTGIPKYVLTVDPNGGTWNGSTESKDFTQDYNTTKTIALPNRSGYTFNGWSLSGGGRISGTTYTYGTTNGTLTAEWTALPTYTITYNANGGSGTMSNGTKTHNVAYTIADNSFTAPTKESTAQYSYSYSFAGWNTKADGTGTSYAASNSYSDNANLSLYAQWRLTSTVRPYKQIVQVRYENADGSFTDYKNVIDANYNYGSTVSWSRAADSTYKAASIPSYTVSGPKTTQVTVYRQTHTVTLNKGAGIASVSGAGTYRVGETVTINTTLNSSYEWVNWTGSSTITNQKHTFIMGTSDLTYTANGKKTIASYKVVHQQEQLDDTYKVVDTENLTGTVGASVTPAVKTYTGFKSPATKTVTVAADNSTVVNYYYTRNNYTVTYIDVVGSNSGKELGRSTASKPFGSAVRGADKGSSTTVGAYYQGYYYVSDTSATVTTSGATVYRYFKPQNYTITYIDVVGSNSGKELGRTTASSPFASTVRGADLGNSTTVSAYYTGYYYVSDTSATVNISGATVYRYFKPQNYTVTYIDVVDSKSGKELGRSTALKPFDSTVRGADLGNSKTDNAYHNGYYYDSDTSATVTTSGATVYRIFKLKTVNKTVTINWNDKSNAYGSRPKEVTLLLMSGNTIAGSKVLTGNNSVPSVTNSWTYTFVNLQKYDTATGKEIVYKLIEGATKKDGTIVRNFVPSLNGALDYSLSYDSNGLSVTNKAVPTSAADYGITVSGEVTWKDGSDKYHFRPKSVTVTLLQNNNPVKTIVLPEGTTNYKFTGLDFFDSNMNENIYTVREDTIDYYKITQASKTVTDTKTDEYGNIVTTTSYVADFTNTFAPNGEDPEDQDSSNPPVRYSDNQLTVKTSYLMNDSPATDDDFKKLLLNKESQILNITLKQLNLIWKKVDSEQGKYIETYEGYSGYEINNIITGENVTSLTNIPYGKYEIIVSNATNFNLKDITELNTKNVTFSQENGKYYVTYSYKYEEEKESLNINMFLNENRVYTSKQKVNNYFNPEIII